MERRETEGKRWQVGERKRSRKRGGGYRQWRGKGDGQEERRGDLRKKKRDRRAQTETMPKMKLYDMFIN